MTCQQREDLTASAQVGQPARVVRVAPSPGQLGQDGRGTRVPAQVAATHRPGNDVGFPLPLSFPL